MMYLITGGSRGLGKQLVLDLISHGSDVAFTYLVDRVAAEHVETQARQLRPGSLCRGFKLDQRISAEVELVYSAICDEVGSVDVLLNNAAVNRNSLALTLEDEDWINVLSTNLFGPFFLCRQILPDFLSKKRGRFIHISSVAMAGASGQIAYATSKSGLSGLSGTLAREYGRRGVTSNILVLGLLAGGMSESQASDDIRRNWNSLCPAGREGLFGEVSGAVRFLASDAASYINGAELHVTGAMDWVP